MGLEVDRFLFLRYGVCSAIKLGGFLFCFGLIHSKIGSYTYDASMVLVYLLSNLQ